MEGPTTTSTTRGYPPYLTATLWAIGAAAVLSLIILVGGTPHPRWAAAFVAGVSLLFWASLYRRAKFKKQGIEHPPPFFNSVPLEIVVMTIATGLYGLAIGVLIGTEPRASRRMGVTFALLGGIFAYRRRRWPRESLRYDFYAGAAALIGSVLLGLLVDRVFRG